MAFLRNFGLVELIIVLVIAILLFGPGRIGKIGAELGKGIRGFRNEVKTAKEDKPDDETEA